MVFFFTLSDAIHSWFALLVIIFTVLGASIAISSSDRMSMLCSVVIVSVGKSLLIYIGMSSSNGIMSVSLAAGTSSSKDMVSFIGLTVWIVFFETFLTSCLSLSSNRLSSIQMSSVLKFLCWLFSFKMPSIKLMALVCSFCSAAASLTLSNSCFSWENSSFTAFVSEFFSVSIP